MSDHSRRDILALGASAAVIALTWKLAATGDGSAIAATPAPLKLSDAEWRKRLSPAAYDVLRQGGTEMPGSSPLNDQHGSGIFACAGCALPVFSSKTKFDSGTGWPSFYDHLPHAIATRAE